ncbi:hypothetical protein C9374_006510 [Naegleria lovaniensis]|uniref:Uncharacterized protein n=1 Tax=Naegleria lovaniensis TaxID=51637 RepID=A0AA88G8V7_NAELO|nr:uncharacterized protein C9374_012124 [Naegleria lovaniensis]XP_044547201.1 uncharacterized protein C9374_006510 [Naegleria lovaniensis]KAG2373517.1 hypothetical protein C9374_012124 [Naegleria lovaniensis]KAG2381521.1 hypothetical protein C9374_006510 [Naegleria lovaniensis]
MSVQKGIKAASEYVKEAIATTEKFNKKGANLFDLLSRTPKNGVDSCYKRKNWRFDTYYKITKVILSADGKHGTAWGIHYYHGKARSETHEKIHGALKKDLWKHIPQEKLQQYAISREVHEYDQWILENAMKQNEEAVKNVAQQ